MASIVQKDINKWEVFFEGMPDWAIPLIKIVPEFYTSDEYAEQWNEFALSYNFEYIWQKIDTSNYKLYITIGAVLKIDYDSFPLFLDLNLYFINTNNRTNVQHQLGF